MLLRIPLVIGSFAISCFILYGFLINIVQVVFYLALKCINKQWFRKINSVFSYLVHSQLAFIGNWFSRSEFYLYVDENDYKQYFGKEHFLYLMNHSYEVDWIILGPIIEKIHHLGKVYGILKHDIKYVPSIGWNFYFSESIFLQRSKDKDKNTIEKGIANLMTHSDPVCILLFPEGTRFTTKKHEISLKYAKANGLPLLKHHLTPRTTGFLTLLPPMRNNIKAIYNIQLVLKKTDSKIKPSVINMFGSCKVEGHIYIERIPLEQVPNSEEGAAKFLHDLYVRKDKLHDSFLNTGDFFTESGVKRVKRMKITPTYRSLIHTSIAYTIITSTIIYYTVYYILTGNTFTRITILLFFLIMYAILKKLVGVSQMKPTTK